MSINADVQKLELTAIVEFYILDLTPIPGASDIYYWTPNLNALGAAVRWKGQDYTPWPVELTGLSKTGKGQIPRPTLTIGNITRLLTSLVLLRDDIVGARFTRRRTLYKYLDAVNFAGGVNPTADPTAEFPVEIYYVDRKASETPEGVQFELASPMDVHGVYLPNRQIVQNYCPFIYKNANSGCNFVSSGTYWKADDTTTLSAGEDVCGHRLNSCKIRHANTTVGLPFGGFPGVGLQT
jgi:lambda family phage minor tail protein L